MLPPTFPWPRSGSSTLLILESSLGGPHFLNARIVTVQNIKNINKAGKAQYKEIII